MPISGTRTTLAQKYLSLGRRFFDGRAFAGAERCFRLAYDTDPSCGEALARLAGTADLCGRPEDACFYRGAAAAGIDIRPRGGRLAGFWRLASEFQRSGDPENMRYSLRRFLAAERGAVSAETFMARCMLAEYGEACAELAALTAGGRERRGVSLLRLANPWRFQYPLPAKYFLGHLRGLKRTKKTAANAAFLAYLGFTLSCNSGGLDGPARRRLERLVLAAGEKLDFAFYLLGNSCLSGGEYDKAVSAYKRLLAAGYADWPVHCQLGEALLCKGAVKEGLGSFRAAYAAASGEDKKSPVAWEAQMRLIMGDYSRTAELLRGNRIHYSPCWLGAAYYKLGRYGAALAQLRKAVALQPGDSEARVWLGELYARLGRAGEAEEQFGLVLAGGPNFWASLNRARLAGERQDAAALKKHFGAAALAWPGLIPRVLGKPRGLRKGPAAAAIPGIIERVLMRASGFRRMDEYLLPLALGERPSAGKPGNPG